MNSGARWTTTLQEYKRRQYPRTTILCIERFGRLLRVLDWVICGFTTCATPLQPSVLRQAKT